MPILLVMCMYEEQDGWTPADAKQVLIAGDDSVVLMIQAMLDALPANARGQVFIEVDDARGLPPLVSPGRVTVTWLGRSVRSGAPGTGEPCRHGVALDRAVRAWVGEMSVLEEDGFPSALGSTATRPKHDFCAWVAGRGATIHELAEDVAERLALTAQAHVSH